MELDKDLKIIANEIKNNNFKDSNILITGSTGLIGSLLVKGFLYANQLYKTNNQVYALARNPEKFLDVFNDFKDRKDLIFIKNNITESININEKIDFVFHTACVTTSNEMISHPVELINGSVSGTLNLLNFSKDHKAKAVVYLSSMEAYGVVNVLNRKIKESELGYLDLNYIRNCYPESKRLCEILCSSYSCEYKLNVIIARLTQTFGAGVNLNDNRIFALIAKNAILKQDIVLKTLGKSAHDYCYTTDAISALLLLAKKGGSGECYNVSNNKNFSSIFDMATKVLGKYYPEGKVITEISDTNMFSKDSIISLDTQKIEKLGWKPKINLIEMYDKLINYYIENM